MANPGFVLVFDIPVDGRDELRFRNTHPLIHQYIMDNFERLSDSPNPAYQIYKAKGMAQWKKLPHFNPIKFPEKDISTWSLL